MAMELVSGVPHRLSRVPPSGALVARVDERPLVLPGPVAVYVVVDDPDALHARAAAEGAEIIMGLTDQAYGSREFAARDLDGNVWSFGTYMPSR